MTTFKDLALAQPLLDALANEGYSTPTPIQAQAIPHLLDGKDLLGIAQTGTGKTAAFALPILHRLAHDPKRAERNSCRVLVLSPTRELTSQIAESFRTYGAKLGLTVAVVFGGVGHRPQEDKIRRGVDILVATPGRLIDHMDSGVLRLDRTEVFVLDEADQMLDMGFIHAIRKITPKLPKVRQSLFFSATMPREIGALAADLLRDPVKVSVTPVAKTADRVAQRVIFVETARKRQILKEVLNGEAMGRTLIFTRTKHGADKVVKHLEQDGFPSAAIHGNKSQNQREKALAAFREGKTPILVATDIAARGIDVDGVTHVINFDLPNIPESYVHRIGRTARAGAEGIAISLCAGDERPYLRDIEKLTRQSIPAEDKRISEEDPAAPPQQRGGRPGSGRPGQKPGNRQPRRGGRPNGNAGSRPQQAKGGGERRDAASRDGGGQGDFAGMSFMKPSRPKSGQRHRNGR